MAFIQINNGGTEADMKPELLRSLNDMGYENDEIKSLMPATLKGTNYCAIPFQSMSDLQKSLMFSTSIIETINQKKNAFQAVIMSKSGNFITMVENMIESLTKYMPNKPRVYRTNMRNMPKKIPKHHILVGDPKTILEVFKTRAIDIANVTWAVFNELEKYTTEDYEVVQFFPRSFLQIFHTSNEHYEMIREILLYTVQMKPPKKRDLQNRVQQAQSVKNLKKKSKNRKKKKSKVVANPIKIKKETVQVIRTERMRIRVIIS